MRALGNVGGLFLGGLLSWACSAAPRADDCAVGSVDCVCTPGGGCDLDYQCIDGTCRNLNTLGTGSQGGSGLSGGGEGQPASAGGQGSDTNADSGSSSDSDGIKLDVGAADLPGVGCTQMGCREIDLLFAVDGTGSMLEEIQALSATQAFTQVVEALGSINCGDINFRIGLTNDYDAGFLGAGANGDPWFDSQAMTGEEIANAFNAAVSGLGGPTPGGCEHVLTSATNLLSGDTTGFLRPNALLVIVLITDVDDYGAYDQSTAMNTCADLGFLCNELPTDVAGMYDTLVTLKGDDPAAVATIVVAGDPNVLAGPNSCGQPASCCGVGLGECAGAHHATRLYEFAAMQAGSNGVALDICDGAAQIPVAIETALGEDIDLACQVFEPEG